MNYYQIALAIIVLNAVSSHFHTCQCTAQQVIPLSDSYAPVFVPVRMGYVKRRFMISSGLPYHLVDESLRSLLGEFSHTTDIGNASVALYKVPSIRVAGVELSGGVAMVSDFSSIEEVLGERIDGILGVQLFSENVVRFDLGNRRLEILPSDTKPDLSWGTAVPCSVDPKGVATIRAVVGRHHGSFVIASGLNCNAQVADMTLKALLSTGDAKPFGLALTAVNNSETDWRRSVVTRLDIGDVLKDLEVVDSGSDAAIGMGLMRRFVTTLDFARGKVYFQKGPLYKEVHYGNLSGLHLKLREGRVIVTDISAGSPAAESPIAVGMEVVAVNGKSASKLGLRHVRYIVSNQEAQLKVANEIREFAVRLRPSKEWRQQRTSAPRNRRD